MADPLPIAWLNGRFQALAEIRLSPLDRGFLFADGVYEVVPVYAGVPFELGPHLDRLEASLAGIRLANPLSRRDWEGMVHELVERNGGGDVCIYFQVTRGADSGRDHGFPAETVPATCFAMATPLPPTPERIQREGGRGHLVEDNRWARCDIKSIALLPNVLAKQAARDQGADEALFHRDGLLLEGSSTTLFLVHQGILKTPPRDERILPGITREVILSLAQEAGIEALETELPLSTLAEARELWVCSSSRELLPISRVDEQIIGTGKPGPVWQQLQSALVARSRQQQSVSV